MSPAPRSGSALRRRSVLASIGSCSSKPTSTALDWPRARSTWSSPRACSTIRPDPRDSFARIAQLARPGGAIVLGVYNAFARIPLRFRRAIARLSGFRVIPFDPVLRERQHESARREAWLRDQYHHPEEHRHTLAEVQAWFKENEVTYVRAYPSAVLGDEPKELFASAVDNWRLEGWLAQLAGLRRWAVKVGSFLRSAVVAERRERMVRWIARRPTLMTIVIASLGAALVAAALLLESRWFDRHFLPSFFLPRRWYVLIHNVARSTMAMIGVSLALSARSMAAKLTAGVADRALQMTVAAVLALGSSELVLRRVHLRPVEWLRPEEEPRRQLDRRLGWTFVPARTGHNTIGGRTIEYALDAAGYRVRRVDEPVDPDRPTILFIGESVMFGEGLDWDETVPAQVGTMMDVQSANLAVHGYSTDQAYLRLQEELPRFRHPVAVVSLFMTALFGRNLDDDRPHLGPGLVWMPAEHHARLVSIGRLLVPYRRDETVENGIRVTREVLRATVSLARSGGATPLIVVPQLGPEEPAERTLRGRILDGANLPYVFVPLDGTWHLSWDRHPNAQAAHLIAAAIAGWLRGGERAVSMTSS